MVLAWTWDFELYLIYDMCQTKIKFKQISNIIYSKLFNNQKNDYNF